MAVSSNEYPGGSDFCLEDKVGAQFSLTWGRTIDRELVAELAVNDGIEGRWSAVNLGTDQLVKIVAHILFGLSKTGRTYDQIMAALEAA